ncbi:endo alpha-1,4 polygalactosaminidase [Alcanivorax sp. S6407]|uniref:bifunctional glycoside hydrolase 114/ polysaccharide deacetylase family protein n=1 Tax=Alcanivorax sp. S6407 TaxID=2926424 RepID=UPI001FF223D5|nr:endo alpha-1,4 polygalactosaminidase [Alcanivorax sp. S6407]
MYRLMILLGLTFFALSSRGATAPDSAAAFYYGDAIPWAELSLYDYPVVEPGQADSVPADFRDQSFYAYVSLGEVLASRAYFSAIQPEWRLGKNPNWGSFILDQSSPQLRALFLDEVFTPLWEQGYRGFFLDTLDSYQLAVTDEPGRQAQRAGLAALINAVGERFPDARFIFNRGFELMPLITAQVDAIAAESLYQGWQPDKQTYQAIPEPDRAWLLEAFRQSRETYGVDSIAIDYAPPAGREQARSLAKSIAAHGIIPWVTNPAIDSMGVGIREVVPRKVLVIHGGNEERTWELSDVVRYGLMPLQFQGLVPEILGVDDPMPSGALQGRYAGIMTWLETDGIASPAFEDWLVSQREAGVPIAMVGYPAVDPLGPNGGIFGFQGRNNPRQLPRAVTQHPDMGFEAPLPAFMPVGEPLYNTQVTTPWLELVSGTQHYMPVAMTEWGGYAFNPYVIRSTLPTVEGKGLERWMLNPLTFLHDALQLPEMPIPDVTTENGKRLLFAHIDGDGFPSLAEVEGYQGQPDALVLLEEVLKKFKVPTTVSIIEAEVSPQGLYPKMAPRLEHIARQIFSLAHVEAATHTYSHPFFWYDAEEYPTELNGPEGQLRLPVPNYSMTSEREVVGSTRYIDDNLLPPGKKTRMVLWSGDTIPSPEALKLARENGLLNMNGSDTVITRSSPTWTLIRGIGLPKGEEYQVYAPNQNENIYTNEWSGPFYGFNRVIETFELTETPHRFKPVDVYYHTYIASKNASLQSLLDVYRWVGKQDLHPVFASEYVRKVLDFNDMVIAREGDRWLVRGGGELRTVRLPTALPLPDMTSSEGVAGYHEDKPGRYLHLVGEQASWQGTASPQGPYLQQANARLTAFQKQPDGFRFSLLGYDALSFTLANVSGCQLKHNGRVLSPTRRSGGIYHYRSAQHGLEELRLECSH